MRVVDGSIMIAKVIERTDRGERRSKRMDVWNLSKKLGR